MSAVTKRMVNKNDESKAEITDYSGETTCLGGTSVDKARRKQRILANANFVTVCEAALGLEGPVDDIAANVKHGYEV